MNYFFIWILLFVHEDTGVKLPPPGIEHHVNAYVVQANCEKEAERINKIAGWNALCVKAPLLP